MSKKALKHKFITDYIEKHRESISILHEDFMDSWADKFGTHDAGRWLGKLYKIGVLDRARVPLGTDWCIGFPRWVYCYKLSRMWTDK